MLPINANIIQGSSCLGSCWACFHCLWFVHPLTNQSPL